MADVHWLGARWDGRLFHASDYFDQLYEWAEDLVRAVQVVASGEALLAPMRSVATPVLDSVRPMSFAAVDGIHMDPTEPMPAVARTGSRLSRGVGPTCRRNHAMKHEPQPPGDAQDAVVDGEDRHAEREQQRPDDRLRAVAALDGGEREDQRVRDAVAVAHFRMTPDGWDGPAPPRRAPGSVIPRARSAGSLKPRPPNDLRPAMRGSRRPALQRGDPPAASLRCIFA